MATLATQIQSTAGAAPVFSAASAGGDGGNAGPTTVLRVKNASGAAVTITVAALVPCSQGFVHNLVVAVPAGAEADIGPLVAQVYANSTGVMTWTYSATASVSVALMA